MKYLNKSLGGVILNVSSTAALIPFYGVPYYAASKGAVLAYTRAVAQQKRSENIAVICLCPHLTETSHFTDIKGLKPGFDDVSAGHVLQT